MKQVLSFAVAMALVVSGFSASAEDFKSGLKEGADIGAFRQEPGTIARP